MNLAFFIAARSSASRRRFLLLTVLLAVLACVSGSPGAAHAQGDLRVLPESSDDGPTKQMLSRYLERQAYAALDRRLAEYEQIDTPEEIELYQRRTRAVLVERLGGFPERTPLNPEIVGKLDGDGFRIEKVIYESQPRHHVTAALFLPKSRPPFPAVVVPCGHSRTGKAAQQRVCILLATYCIAALSYDPIGQA